MKKYILIIISVLIVAGSSYGEDYGTSTLKILNLGVGARAGGMGEAYSAVAKDATAINWNVAGLGLVRAYEVNYMHMIYGQDVSFEYASISLPADFGTFGINLNFLHMDKLSLWKAGYQTDKNLTYYELFVSLGFAREFLNFMSIGVNAKYINSKIGIKSEQNFTVNSIAFDIGVLFAFDLFRIKKIMKEPEKNFRFGVTYRNIGPKVTFDQARVSLPMDLKVGVYYKPIQYFDVSYDIGMGFSADGGFHLDRSMSHHIGIEIMPDWYVTGRGGFKFWQKQIMWTLGAGANIRFGTMKISADYAFNYDRNLGFKHWISVAFYKFSVSLAKFNFGKINISDVFPAMYKFYSKDKIGVVEVKNNTDIPVEKVKLSFFVKEYMDFPSESKEIDRLQPKKTVKFEIPASFNSKVLEITEDTPMQAQLRIEYYAQGQKKLIQSSKSFKMFNRNAMVWDDIGKLASFVTPKDTIVKVYARNLVSTYKNKNIGNMNRNLFNAMLVFDALGATGLTYVLDPQSPLRQREKTMEVVDYIQFPRDTIRFKSGDCDDCTVLFSSLMEHIGIQTALIDLQEHILMMFNTGVPENAAGQIASSSKMYVIKDGYVWIPVETTLIGSSFSKAWQTGISEYYKGKESRKLTVIDVSKAQSTYNAVTLPEITWEPKMPSTYKIDKFLNQDMKFANDIGMKNVLQGLKAKLKKNPKDLNTLNKVGIMLSKTGDTEEGVEYLEKAVKLNPKAAKYHNNLGNAYFVMDEINKAQKEYEEAIRLDPDNPKYHINLGTLYNYIGNTKKATEEFDKAELLLTK